MATKTDITDTFIGRLTALAEDMYTGRPVHPYNITDLIPMACGAVETMIERELKKHPAGSALHTDYLARLNAVRAGFAAYQAGARTLASEG
jgi:hypothetical protein